MADTELPEGTDHAINGADDGANAPGREGARDAGASTARTDTDGTDTGGRETSGRDTAGGHKDATDTGAFFDKIEGWRTQGYDKARDYAMQGKERATGAIDDLLRMIGDAAGQVDDKIGSQYGDYARKASSGLESFNEALKGKDVDELFTEARDMVAKAPAVAIGAAAALGFVVARLAKAGMDSAAEAGKPQGAKPKKDA